MAWGPPLRSIPVVGRDVRHGLFDIEGAGSVVQAHVEVRALLAAGVDGLTAGPHLDAADVVPVHALEGHVHVRQRRLADGVVEEVREPVLEAGSKVPQYNHKYLFLY